MNLLWAILCERNIIDKDTNNLSLFNVIEEFTISAEPPQDVPLDAPLPDFPFQFWLVSLWVRAEINSPESGDVRLRVLLPNGNEAENNEFQLDLHEFIRTRHRIRFNGLPQPTEGEYLFVFESRQQNGDWVWKGQIPLRVVVRGGI